MQYYFEVERLVLGRGTLQQPSQSLPGLPAVEVSSRGA